jgi:beta-glucosidase-like glycosyl hydrolase/CubicO group peptidase (beta-lactamase class C family)
VKKFIIIFPLFFLAVVMLQAQGIQRADSLWADSVFRQLSPEQKIAQLFMIRAYSYKDSTYKDSLTAVVSNSQPGGICFFKGTPYAQAGFTNRLQTASKVPMLVAIDAEWGLGMRLDSVIAFPRPITLGAMTNDTLIYQMAAEIAADCRRLGIQINFAPVADINCNPLNPVINFRSFGENKYRVAAKSLAYMKGLQDNGVMAVAKHFPGHGDTDSDSHLTLPIIRHSIERMDSVELYPFKVLIKNGVEGIMIAHLFLPCYDTSLNAAATLSRPVVSQLLREKLGFKGFAITDALDMQGVAKYFKAGEIELKALQAGNDILLLPQNVEEAIRYIKAAADSNVVPWAVIDKTCFRILMLKSGLGASKTPVDMHNLHADLNRRSSVLLQKEGYASALTLVKNELGLIPLISLDKRHIAYLGIGDKPGNKLSETLGDYADVSSFFLPHEFGNQVRDSILNKLKTFGVIIIGLHNMTGYPTDNFHLSRQALELADTISKISRAVLVVFGNPYSLGLLPKDFKAESILVAYQDFPVIQLLAAEVLFGGIPARGHLPVSPAGFHYGAGEETDKTRVSFVMPEEIGLTESSLGVIDSLAEDGIVQGAYPGCQVLLAKDGKVFYNKAFGHPQYNDTVKTDNDDLYDIASVTKVAATTLAIMKLYEEGKLDPSDSLGSFLTGVKGSNKSGMCIRDIMTHRAGLQSWIPFYKKVSNAHAWDTSVFRSDSSGRFPIKVADHLYILASYPDSIYKQIIQTPLGEKAKYLYSDLGFYLLRLVVEKLSGKPFELYLDETFYKPLGLSHTGFNPYKKFPIVRIMPTENDTEFRKQLVRGYVHDPGAAMLGGISGHAGIFTNSLELGVIMQMLLNQGSYGGKQFLLPSTVKEFTSCQFPGSGNRRALGFDKPLQNYKPDSPTCKSASPESFGHSGFTGTYTWADPSNGLLYIFLSNRVCPSAANQKLRDMNIRTNIQQAVYDLFEKFGVK